jgi:hypothetical protein
MGLKGKTEGLSPKIFCPSEAPLNVPPNLLCHPERSEGSHPMKPRGVSREVAFFPFGMPRYSRQDKVGRGCLANARHDGVGDFF